MKKIIRTACVATDTALCFESERNLHIHLRFCTCQEVRVRVRHGHVEADVNPCTVQSSLNTGAVIGQHKHKFSTGY